MSNKKDDGVVVIDLGHEPRSPADVFRNPPKFSSDKEREPRHCAGKNGDCGMGRYSQGPSGLCDCYCPICLGLPANECPDYPYEDE